MKNEQVIIDLKEYERLKKVDLEKQDVNVSIKIQLEYSDYSKSIDLWTYIDKIEIGDKINYEDIINTTQVIKNLIKEIDKKYVSYVVDVNYHERESVKFLENRIKEIDKIKSKWWYKLFN